MDDILQQNIAEMLEAIKGVAPVVWNAYLRQEIMFGTMQTIVGAAFLILSIISIRKVLLYAKLRQREEKEWQKMSDSEFYWLWVSGVLVICVLIFLPQGILRLSNPEYYAIKNIIGTLSGGG